MRKTVAKIAAPACHCPTEPLLNRNDRAQIWHTVLGVRRRVRPLPRT